MPAVFESELNEIMPVICNPRLQDAHPRLLRRRPMPPRTSSSSLASPFLSCSRFLALVHTNTHTHIAAQHTHTRESRVSRYHYRTAIALGTPLITTSASLNRDGGTMDGKARAAVVPAATQRTNSKWRR